MDKNKFGPSIKARRLKLGISRKELGALVGCSETNIRKIEEDGQQPKWPLAHAILSALGRKLVLGRGKKLGE